jgi:predicted DNA-binding transcriptional regulator YafY
MKIDRLLSITLMLINHPMVTAKELSEKFEVSIRTIYRDIDSISAAGIPVTSYQGKKGGFCLIENYRVDRQLLHLNDLISIVTALKGINTSLDNIEISDTIEKIESLVPGDKREQAQRMYNQIIIDISHWEQTSEHKTALQTVHASISSNHIISFDYRNLRGEDTKRNIEPMSLILKGSCWYLYGFCRKRNDYRIFRLSRMRNIESINQTFALRDHPFSEADFFDSNKRKPVQITLSFRPSAKSRVEEFFGQCPMSTDKNGFITVDVLFPEDEWVYSTLLSYGEDCEVISPPHIREIIRTRLENALSFYKT